MNKKTIKSSLLLLACIFSTDSYSYNQERAKSNLAYDYAECSSYFIMNHKAMKSSGMGESASNAFLQLALKLLNISSSLSNENVAQARVEITINKMAESIKNDFSNYSILINKYNDFCENLLIDPTERFEYWLKKKGAENEQ